MILRRILRKRRKRLFYDLDIVLSTSFHNISQWRGINSFFFHLLPLLTAFTISLRKPLRLNPSVLFIHLQFMGDFIVPTHKHTWSRGLVGFIGWMNKSSSGLDHSIFIQFEILHCQSMWLHL